MIFQSKLSKKNWLGLEKRQFEIFSGVRISVAISPRMTMGSLPPKYARGAQRGRVARNFPDQPAQISRCESYSIDAIAALMISDAPWEAFNNVLGVKCAYFSVTEITECPNKPWICLRLAERERKAACECLKSWMRKVLGNPAASRIDFHPVWMDFNLVPLRRLKKTYSVVWSNELRTSIAASFKGTFRWRLLLLFRALMVHIRLLRSIDLKVHDNASFKRAPVAKRKSSALQVGLFLCVLRTFKSRMSSSSDK